jgi:hypothetical protein
MANRIVVQPNGLFARFSDIVDHFTHFNCSREELWLFYRDEAGVRVADSKFETAIEAGNDRFEDEIETIRFVHGPLEADRTRAFLSAPCEEGQEPNLPVPPMFRADDEAFDVEAEIAAYESYLPTFTEDNDDEFHMRDNYASQIKKLRAFVTERNAATDAVHQSLVASALDGNMTNILNDED